MLAQLLGLCLWFSWLLLFAPNVLRWFRWRRALRRAARSQRRWEAFCRNYRR